MNYCVGDALVLLDAATDVFSYLLLLPLYASPRLLKVTRFNSLNLIITNQGLQLKISVTSS